MMEMTLIFFVFGLTVNAKSEDLQDYQSLQSEIPTYPTVLPSKEQNNPSHNSRKASTESLPRLTVALIASPGTDLFHAPHERHHSTPVNTMTATADEVIGSRGDRFVSNQSSSSFTSSGDHHASAMQPASKANLEFNTDVKREERTVTSTEAASEFEMNSGMMAAAHVSRGREKIAASLHAPLNSKNQRAVESITLLPTKSIAMLPASDLSVIDNLGEATETKERQRKSINENGAQKTLGITKPPQNATESLFTDGEKTLVQKGSPNIMRLTAVPNKTQLDEESSAAGVKMVAREPRGAFEKGQSGQKNMNALSLVTCRNRIFDVDTPLPLGLSGQEVVKATAQRAKLLTTKGQASIVMAYTNAADEKFLESRFSHRLEVPLPTTVKPSVTRSLVTFPLPPKMLQRLVSAGDETKGELTTHSISTRDGKVGMKIYSPSQSLQSTTTVKVEGILKFVTVLPSKFKVRSSVNTPSPLGLSGQQVVKGTSQSTKLPTTKGHAVMMLAYSNAVDKNLKNVKFSHPSEVPFPMPDKLYITRSFVTLPLTSKLLQRIVSTRVKSQGELTNQSISIRGRKVGTTISDSTSQSVQRTSIEKDERMPKFVTVLPSKFTDKPSVLSKVKNATQPDKVLLEARRDISSTDRHFFHRSESCCKVSIENPQVKEKDDNFSLTDNITRHFHTLINKLMPAASSTTQFPVDQRAMTISAQSKNDSDSEEQSERVVTKLTPSQLISASNGMHQLVTSDHSDQWQKIPTTAFQIPPREIQNLSPIFKGHAVTYSPVRQRLIPSLTGRAKPLTFLSSPTGHSPFHQGHVLKGHPLIVPLGHSTSSPKLVTFQGSTSFQRGNKNSEPTMFQKLLTSHFERLIRTTNTKPVTGRSSVKSFSTQFTSTAGSDKESTLLLSVSSLGNALQAHHNSTVPTKKFGLVENIASPSHFLTVSPKNVKKPQERMTVGSSQDLVLHQGQTAVFSNLLRLTERSVIRGDLDLDLNANQMLVTEQPKENAVSHSVSVSIRKKSAGQTDFSRRVFTPSHSKKQYEQNRSAETKGESSTGALVFDQYDQNSFSMQNKNQTPATVLMENTVSFSQSRGKDLRNTTQGQIDASVSPAAVESFRSTQPLASLAVRETPKMAVQMINQAISLSSTSSANINAASNGKDLNSIPLSSFQTTQYESSTITNLHQLSSSQSPSSKNVLKRDAINSAAVNHMTLNTSPPSTPPALEPTTGLMKSAVDAGRNMQSTSRLTASKWLTDFSTTSSTPPQTLQPHVLPMYNVEDNIIQTSLPSVTEATFFAVDHSYGSTASFERTAAESPQTGPLQLLETSETSEGRLSTVFPFETSLSKSAEMMSDLPVMQKRMRIASPDFLSGLAQISDDICGSGNYTAEMRLTLERDIIPGDLVPALSNLHVVINLKTNSTQVNLEIKSCCLSPTVTLDEFNTTCCLFSRLPIDPQGIRLLPSVLSKRASFTISLFQMINYSTAYLHCDLSVCLRNSSECERCQQNRNAHFADEDEIIFSNTGNRISFGPVLKDTDISPFIETTGLDSAEVAAILVSVSSCFLVCVALLLLWMVYRHHLERSGHRWIPYGCSHNGEHFIP